jgi:hypothetical protein
MTEAEVSIAVCFFVVIITLLGIVIYYQLIAIKEQRAQNLKQNVLINGIIDIFETKYRSYGEEDDDKGGISPGG